MISNKEEQDKLCTHAWVSLINEFKAIVSKYSLIKLTELRSKVKTNAYLTYRQLDALISRCDNLMNGDYGNTKTTDHLNQGKPSSKKAA